MRALQRILVAAAVILLLPAAAPAGDDAARRRDREPAPTAPAGRPPAAGDEAKGEAPGDDPAAFNPKEYTIDKTYEWKSESDDAAPVDEAGRVKVKFPDPAPPPEPGRADVPPSPSQRKIAPAADPD